MHRVRTSRMSTRGSANPAPFSKGDVRRAALASVSLVHTQRDLDSDTRLHLSALASESSVLQLLLLLLLVLLCSCARVTFVRVCVRV